MSWRRLGRIFAPPDPPIHPALATHAANPLAWPLPDGRLRILYNGRDVHNRAAIGAVDCDLATLRTQSLSEPLYMPRPGEFGADGVSIGGWLLTGEARELLVMGWTLSGDGGWCGTIGAIAAHADGTLAGRARPLLAPEGEARSYSYPCAFRDGDGEWVMLFEATLPGPLHPLCAARSADGRRWQLEGTVLVPEPGLTTGFARPCVLRDSAGWRLWMSRLGPAGERYHIATATSVDGRTWAMESAASLSGSGVGWDGAMACYPDVFEQDGRRLMLYNGDGFGRTGFGLAEWEFT